MTRYVNEHQSQYDPGLSQTTRSSGCTWTSGANGVDAATGGRLSLTPDQVHAVLSSSEETSPSTPGWSLPDLDKAMARLGVGFAIGSGGWAELEAKHDAGFYVVIQGDSDQFSGLTCSGDFNGDHAIGAHPDEDSDGDWRIDDPICPGARFEGTKGIRAYAEKFARTIGTYPALSWGYFTDAVPLEGGDMPARSFLFDSNTKMGRVDVLGPGHAFVLLRTAELKDLPVVTGKRAFGPVTLIDQDGKPIGPGGPTDTRTRGYILENDAAFAIEADVKFTADASGDDFVPAGALYVKKEV